jgi:REP element-mobilizing transposase RayT
VGEKAGVPHVRRPELKARHPVHVTMRLKKGLPSLRRQALAGLVFSVFRTAREKLKTRLVQFSVQSNHLHLIVETAGKSELSRAMKGLAVRLARRRTSDSSAGAACCRQVSFAGAAQSERGAARAHLRAA